MKYKVGDKVKVRSDLEVDKVYGDISFNNYMAEHSGQIVTIIEVDEDMEISFYKIEESAYWFSEEMFENITVGDKIDKLLKDPKTIYEELGKKILKLEEQIKELEDNNNILRSDNDFLRGKVNAYEYLLNRR